MQIFLSGGIGDVFALLSMMTLNEMSSLRKIYWASKAAPALIPLFQNTFPKVINHILSTNKTYFTIDGARRYHDIPQKVQDWSIMTRFQEFADRPFTTCPFLTDDPINLDRFKLPSRFAVVQHDTTLHTSTESRLLRSLDSSEWEAILARLKALDLVGVVLNSQDATEPPDSPLLLDLVGKTTLAESIAILRQASGQFGIISGLATLGAQLFNNDQLWLKGPESWLIMNRHIYLAPHTDFDFLYEHLTNSQSIRIDTNMKQIVMNKMRIVNSQLVGPGSVISVEPHIAEALIALGQAKSYEAKDKVVSGLAGLSQTVLKRAEANPVAKQAVKVKEDK